MSFNDFDKLSALLRFLKREITVSYGERTKIRLNRLFNDTPLGDREPSELYNEMEELAQNNVDEEYLRTLWWQRLPSAIRMSLVTMADDVPLHIILHAADKAYAEFRDQSRKDRRIDRSIIA